MAGAVDLPEAGQKPKDKTATPGRVILYNDDWHTFEDVIGQLIKATSCTEKKAEKHALNVHNNGREVVFNGKREDCQKVAAILREIRLQTEVDWDD